MAYNSLMMENPQTGRIKDASVGFSWTTLFFGIFVPLVRGDGKWALIMFLLGLLTFGLSWLVFPFLYNKLYLKDLLGNGFKVRLAAHGSVDALSSRLGMSLPLFEESARISA
jgi:hypothetical protein